jgi:U3 small nucleolar ribonucleoprotein component
VENFIMDDIVARAKPEISAQEMERRREVVRRADAQNRIEGQFRGPETDDIVEAFIRGDIEVTDMAAQFEALPWSE